MPLPSKLVLAFSTQYILVAIFRSIKEAADLCGVTRQCIMQNLQGKSIIANNRYWRTLPGDYIVDTDDIGKLTLFEFDKQAGNPDRIIYQHKAVKAKRKKIKVKESCAPQH